MFCTDKERQTCDVEKRGCEGCYYNGMSEEEIIENVKYEISIADKKGFCSIGKHSLQGLLNLYNQEKEERRKADHNFDELTIKMAKLDTELQQEKEKNKKAIEYIDRWEINSIGTPFSYTAPGKELLKILKGEE